MRAGVVLPRSDTIEVREVPDPSPGPGAVLVRVRAAGVNRADLAARAGGVRPGEPTRAEPDPFVGGMELAGEVVRTTPGSPWRVGDRVMGRGAGYAELAAVPGDRLMRVPDVMGWDEAGGLPVALTTAHEALVTIGELRPGQTVLVNAATSGVGLVAVQLAAAIGAGTILAASRSADKLAVLAAHLAELPCALVTICTSSEDLVDGARRHTAGQGADLVVDLVGAATMSETISATRARGRIVQVGRLGGRVARIDLDVLASRRLELVGLSFRSRTPAEHAEVVQGCVNSLGPGLDGVRPRIERAFALEDVVEAQEQLALDRHVGKLVLVPDPAAQGDRR